MSWWKNWNVSYWLSITLCQRKWNLGYTVVVRQILWFVQCLFSVCSFWHFSSSLDTLPPVKFVDSNPWLSESTHELELLDFTFLSARYDEEQEEWTLCTNLINENQSVRRPVAIVGRRRPMSDHALQQIKHKSKEAIRYKGENLLNYELDMPLRTTYEYKNPKVSASLQAVLQEAMQTEDDIDITDVSP